jgi:hypothetical protein
MGVKVLTCNSSRSMHDPMSCFVACPYTLKCLEEVFSDVWHAGENGQGSSIELEAAVLLLMFCDLGALFVGKAAIQCEMPGGSADLALPTSFASVDTLPAGHLFITAGVPRPDGQRASFCCLVGVTLVADPLLPRDFREYPSLVKPSSSARSAVREVPKTRPRHYKYGVFGPRAGGRRERGGVFTRLLPSTLSGE